MSSPLSGRGLEGSRSAYVAVSIFLQLGYILQIKKCCFTPLAVLPWLGFTVDFVGRRFGVTEVKLRKLQALISCVIEAAEVDPLALGRIIGKCGSLRLAIPAALLFVRAMYSLLATARTSRRRGAARFRQGPLKLLPQVVFELQFWVTEVTLVSAAREARVHSLRAAVGARG
jgi:hypothetical protein